MINYGIDLDGQNPRCEALDVSASLRSKFPGLRGEPKFSGIGQLPIREPFEMQLSLHRPRRILASTIVLGNRIG